jgi:hypothetical protein
MAKQIILINGGKTRDQLTYQVAFWYPISSQAQTKTNGSIWTGATTAENTAIQNGSVLEEVEPFNFPGSTTLGTIKDTLSSRWVTRNSQIAGVGPNQYVGIFFDSSTFWSA